MKNKRDSLDQLKAWIRTLVPINEDHLEAIVNQFEYRTIAKNEFLLKKGVRCDFWGVVHTGLLRVYSFDSTGQELTNGFYREGSLITESVSFFTASVSMEYIEALEDTALLCINFNKLQNLYDDYPAFDKFTRIRYEQLLVGLKTRILYRVQFDAKTRYLHLMETQPELLQRVPLKYIASYLSITDSTLSRIRRKISRTAG